MRRLFYVLLLVRAVYSQTVNISVKAPKSPYFNVVSATDPRVASWTASAVETYGPEHAQLLPFSIFLENNSSHAVIAYSIRISFVDAVGKSGGHNRQYFNLERQSNGMEIPAHGRRLITPFLSIDTGLKPSASSAKAGVARLEEVIRLGNQLRQQHSAVVSLDLLVIDDGLVLGPDEGDVLSYLEGYIAGEREFAGIAKLALETGAPLQDLAARLKVQADELATGRARSFRDLARGNLARRFAALCQAPEALSKDVNRVFSKQIIVLHR